jgi:beta-ribofuranosylaminobenzene 5'-phosphate synthase
MEKRLKQRLEEIENEISVTPFLRALLLTDGSITTLLEAFTNLEIKVAGLKQKTVPAGDELAVELNINPGEELNEREVILLAGNAPVVYAKSYAVIPRLDGEARNDILKTDIPIGKILRRHKLETHREIREIGLKQDDKIAGILNLNKDKILFRSYVIIQKNVPLMKIEEYFGRI